ncbi:MAG: hypothetical protein E6054_07600 [Klebsiella michiganensis]|nr:hypothetical protein [Klebsiella michiganensis]
MTPDKDIMDFVFAEQHPSGGVTLLIDGNRRKEPAIQRWVMDVTREYRRLENRYLFHVAVFQCGVMVQGTR